MEAALAAIAGFLSSVGSNIMNRIVSRLWRVFTTIVSYLFMNIFHWTARMFPEQAAEMWKTIVESYYVLPAEWAEPISDYVSMMTGSKVDVHDIAGGTMNVSAAVGKAFLYPMLNLILPGAEITPGGPPHYSAKLEPEDGMKGAEMFMATNLHFQMSAWLLHVLGDMQSFGMFKSLKDLPNAISWSYGLGWLSWLVMGVPFRMAISDPMEKYFNYVYRPSELTRKMIVDAMQAGYLTQEDALERLRYLGWDEDEIALIFKLEREKLSISEMSDLLRYGLIDHADVLSVYRHRGHDPMEAEALAVALINKPVDALLEKIAVEAMDLYESGLIDVQSTLMYLRGSYKTPEEIGLLFTLAEMRMVPRVKQISQPRSLSPSQIGARYKAGQLDRVEAESLLMAIPYQTDQVGLFLGYYLPDVEKTPEPMEIGRSVVGTLYKAGELTEEQFRIDLEAMGYEGWRVERLVTYYAAIEPAPPREMPPKEIPATWIFKLHEEGHITTDEAIARLMTLGIRESDAALVLSTLHPVATPEALPARALPAGVVGGLYRNGLITRGDALTLFTTAGYGLDAANYLLLYYTPPVPEVEPEEEILTPEIEELSPEEIRAFVLGRVLRPTEVGRLLRDHVLTWHEAFARVRPDLITDREVELFFSLYTKEMQPPEIVRNYDAGVMDYDEALTLATPWFMTTEDAVAYLLPYIHV